jgi:hypothetical protein
MPNDVWVGLELLEAARPKPPKILYKYVIRDRVDVLKNACIRFTPPSNTNDIFEVRQTFRLVMGPKMLNALKEVSKEVDFDEQFAEAVKDSPFGSVPPELMKSFVSNALGVDVETLTRGLLGQVLDHMPDQMNAPENIDRLLDRFASDQLLLSLSARPDSSPMWAHYAANSTGFVIAFNSDSPFFRRGEKGELQGLHKVQYFDGVVPEIFDNPYAALISKQADWGYEHEWRLYVKPEAVSKTERRNGDDIHLVEFPREAVHRVILGMRATDELAGELQELLLKNYPGVPLTRMQADRTTATLSEVPVLH